MSIAVLISIFVAAILLVVLYFVVRYIHNGISNMPDENLEADLYNHYLDITGNPEDSKKLVSLMVNMDDKNSEVHLSKIEDMLSKKTEQGRNYSISDAKNAFFEGVIIAVDSKASILVLRTAHGDIEMHSMPFTVITHQGELGGYTLKDIEVGYEAKIHYKSGKDNLLCENIDIL